MLPAMCRNEACMNIALKTVSHVGSVFSVGIWLAASTALLHSTSCWPLPNGPVRTTAAQCRPGCRSTFGIAPYLTTSSVPGPLNSEPPCRMASKYTTTLIRIRLAVTNGNFPVGMLSFSGITRRGSLCPLRGWLRRWRLRRRRRRSSQGCRASPSSENVHCSVNVVARAWLPARIAVVSRSSM